MTEPPTPSTPVCPECLGRPVDPLSEHVERCYEHQNAFISSGDYIPSGEAGGEANRLWCELLHRGER